MRSTSLPLVSIITPSYNQGWCIERTILSVLKQDYKNIEYIVMDSNSTDETGEILDRYEGRIQKICREKDKGQSDALNRGFKMASGQILAYLNSDDCYASKSVVGEAVSALTSDRVGTATSEVDAVYGRRYFIDKDGFYTRSYPYREFDAELLKKSCYLPQECCFWTREIYERAGGFVDENLRFAMDYDLWLRFLKAGAKFRSLDRVYGLFRWHENQKSQDLWKQVALPEIASLHEKYGHQVMKELDMQDFHEQYDFGVSFNTNSRAFQLAVRLLRHKNDFAQGSLADTPLDYWVYSTV
jgi:glycosyltransferase involved in cell wall biosynthesis